MVKDFQRKNYLTPDGVVGENTAKKIMGVFCDCNRNYAAHFLSQTAHESMNFTRAYESFNYSTDRLLEVFGKYFSDREEAERFSGCPIDTANRVYANRMGNGSEESGDGWKYRGRGVIMLTGRNNYEMFANKVGDLSIIDNPDLVAEKYYFDTAKVFFDVNNIWRYCDDVLIDNIKEVTRVINGGYNGIDDRINLTRKYDKLL